MLLDDSYHSWMHKPPELPPAESTPLPKKSGGAKRKSRYRGRKKRDAS
jgi:hypothetical protein